MQFGIWFAVYFLICGWKYGVGDLASRDKKEFGLAFEIT